MNVVDAFEVFTKPIRDLKIEQIFAYHKKLQIEIQDKNHSKRALLQAKVNQFGSLSCSFVLNPKILNRKLGAFAVCKMHENHVQSQANGL